MSKIPVKTPREVIRAFSLIGYEIVRQKGSHIRLINHLNPYRKPITIPQHDIVKPGLLRKAIRDAGISVDEFIESLKK